MAHMRMHKGINQVAYLPVHIAMIKEKKMKTVLFIWAQNYNPPLKLRKNLVKVTNFSIQKDASKAYKNQTSRFYYVNDI